MFLIFFKEYELKKEQYIQSFNDLGLEDKIEVVKAIMPEFCRTLTQKPEQMQEMMKLMMNLWGQDMAGMMGMMRK
jgi:hypothetical protein